MSAVRDPGDASDTTKRVGVKSANAFRTISEVADEVDVPQHVLRFWETKFLQIRPLKRGGGRRYYRPEDVDLLRRISQLLYREGYTIKGVQRLLREGQLRSDRQESAELPLPLDLEEPEPVYLLPQEETLPQRRRTASLEVQELREIVAELVDELKEIRGLLASR